MPMAMGTGPRKELLANFVSPVSYNDIGRQGERGRGGVYAQMREQRARARVKHNLQTIYNTAIKMCEHHARTHARKHTAGSG